MNSTRDVRDDPRTDFPTRKAEPAREHQQDTDYRETESRSYTPHETVVRNSNADAYKDRGTSWISIIFGWLTAIGAGAILAGIVSGIVGAIVGAGDTVRGAATEGGIAGLVGILITLLLAFLVGGYCAGRLASRSGAKHGLLVAALALLAVLILGGVGALVGSNFTGALSGMQIPALPADAPQSMGTIFTVAGVLALIFPFIGGALGGMWGARTGRQRP